MNGPLYMCASRRRLSKVSRLYTHTHTILPKFQTWPCVADVSAVARRLYICVWVRLHEYGLSRKLRIDVLIRGEISAREIARLIPLNWIGEGMCLCLSFADRRSNGREVVKIGF